MTVNMTTRPNRIALFSLPLSYHAVIPAGAGIRKRGGYMQSGRPGGKIPLILFIPARLPLRMFDAHAAVNCPGLAGDIGGGGRGEIDGQIPYFQEASYPPQGYAVGGAGVPGREVIR